jgi:hypothetical protein
MIDALPLELALRGLEGENTLPRDWRILLLREDSRLGLGFGLRSIYEKWESHPTFE